MEKKNPKIISTFDYIVEVEGAYSYRQHQIFYLKSNPAIKLLLISASHNKAYLLGNLSNATLNIGEEIVETNNENIVHSSPDHFGKVINVNGKIVLPTQSEAKFTNLASDHQTFSLAHNLMTVKPLNQQLFTGIISIDLLIPIGKGQRELIIGDRQTGKTHIALNAIINQAKNGTKCIYVAIGQKREAISSIYNTLKKYGVLNNVIIIDAPATSAYEQYLAPYYGIAYAENLSMNDDVLIVYDDLTKHANIIREIALLTDKPVGKEAMPGDTFFSHSSLLERSGSFVGRKTITALPILQTVDGDITSLIASNIISITDGQIVTSADLFSAGKLPAIDTGLSVSRTGSSVQSRSVTKVAAEVGKIYKAYKRNIKLAMLDYELNKETSLLLYKGKMIEKMFSQKGFSLYSFHFVLLMSKLISWSLLQGIKDEQKALVFLNKLISTNTQAQKAFMTMQSGENYDEEIIKNFFAFALLQYSNYLNLGWEINVKHEFVPLEQSYLEQVAKELGEK
ncbi:ATP F0F1 synthase subunit alpha [Mycoplasmopsis caviae]|uniref:ATP F0F1 synthase subunit alpha n=1 Tax=Mycoplasmopsis caviae TaxID=55603 RepID=A0A3P8MDP4_9BACT|nr:ATP F0F1 synthase subunit alpha [Mycoplasmopsis caviae]UUD35103.1 ATP F0F1 synthase subunit alpha [Mycoplasmopsis caviae]VDR42080.1 ATP synthase F0F1 subunit alpha [Mycoplasmopsis caviae]